MKVTVFGVGYVGLVQGAVLAEVGHNVVCVDVDPAKVELLNKGGIPIYEPGLENLVKRNAQEGRLRFTTDAREGVEHGEIIFIAVGTPPDEDGSADLKYVLAVAKTVAEQMSKPRIVVNKSTVPVGTADKVKMVLAETLAAHGKALAFDVVSNPEFLKEGAAVSDCMRPDRIILGTDSATAEKKLRQLYAPFNRNHDKIFVMDVRSAELTKYAANCMLATKISFMNEMANLAEQFGADIENVRRGIGSDPRIGYHFIYAGCGYGGSCFPKDVQALVRSATAVGYESKILQAVESVNQAQKHKLFSYIHKHFDGQLKGKTVALWGLSFKPNTDDMREASSRVLMEQLWQAGAKVQAFDPQAMEETQRIYGHREDLNLVGTKEAALSGADMLVVCTEWQMFKAPDFDFIKERLSQPVIFDGRNLYEPEQMQELGFDYYGIGRGKSIQGAVL
ncbi:UDP-glucose/GDP-mannose dehydrogenase family protein [Aliiglaciecola sp. CAU 1673]|uniref:UDP-glucose dehydrogenase family protein n=1 Tax=Aliiglaciecola sp. CAU 1673 TaxID=3032595 RepID=UPI0023DB2072|nr:UDP-glucose/GDP-mannose dehydrogenase family protein [Aliiglaciecola sp. CAU 1673]MDF2177979.1 UDP-glucose/GDP-mannose dehydrogenase family protein [Aliiglaciecola sp. CAU 1673]